MMTTFADLRDTLSQALTDDLNKITFDEPAQIALLAAPSDDQISVQITIVESDQLAIQFGDHVEFHTAPGDRNSTGEVLAVIQAAIKGDVKEETWVDDGEVVAARLTSSTGQWTDAANALVMKKTSGIVKQYQAY